jgi:hypothetical protein
VDHALLGHEHAQVLEDPRQGVRVGGGRGTSRPQAFGPARSGTSRG